MPLWSMPRSLALAAALGAASALCSASPAPAADLETLPDGTVRVRIGSLKLYHDPKAWRIEGEGEAFEVHCVGPECDAPAMSIVAVPVDLTDCSPGAVVDRSVLDYPDAWTRTVRLAGAIGLTVHVATLDQGCRNRAGSPVYACTVHQGLAYWFIAPGEMCQTSVAESEALESLLNGLSPATLTDP